MTQADITLSSAYTLLKSHFSGINILCILRFAKIKTQLLTTKSWNLILAKISPYTVYYMHVLQNKMFMLYFRFAEKTSQNGCPIAVQELACQV